MRGSLVQGCGSGESAVRRTAEMLWLEMPRVRNCALLFTRGPSTMHHEGVQRQSGGSRSPDHSAPLLGCVYVSFGGIGVEMRSLFVSGKLQNQSHVYHKSADAGSTLSGLAQDCCAGCTGQLMPCMSRRGSALRGQGRYSPSRHWAELHGCSMGCLETLHPCYLGLWCR